MTDKPVRLKVWHADAEWPDDEMVVKASDYDQLEASRAADKARIAELEGLLRDVKELAEFWINRGSKPGMTKAEYDVWLALGHQSNAMNAIRATLAKHGETK